MGGGVGRVESNEFEARYRFKAKEGHLNFLIPRKAVNREMLRGPQGDYLIEDGVASKLVGREHKQDTQQLDEWTAIARNFIALTFLPLTITSSIMFSAPILICLLSERFLGEKVGIWRWSAILMGFVGVFSYLGAAVQENVSAALISSGTTMVDGVRVYDFSMAIWFWIGCSVVSMLLAASLWNTRIRD